MSHNLRSVAGKPPYPIERHSFQSLHVQAAIMSDYRRVILEPSALGVGLASHFCGQLSIPLGDVQLGD